MFAERDHHRRHHRHLSNFESERSEQNQDKAEEKKGLLLSQKGIDVLTEPKLASLDGLSSKPQELTLSYLCENPKLGFAQKGKQVIISDTSFDDEKWVERDFMNLTETKSNSSSKRQAQDPLEEADEEGNSSRDKKPKLDSTLNLSLALPDVSLSLTASNVLQNVDPVVKPKLTRSMQSLGVAPSHNNTQTTFSNDFTTASVSYSYSHQFSHNPSCSLTRYSTENHEYSIGRDDQMWYGGEGTNGSVHSRFRPIGDVIVAVNNNNNNNNNNSNNHGVGLGANRAMNKDSCTNSLYKTTSSDNVSFFPSELPARPHLEAHSGDSRRKDLENWRDLEGGDGEGKARKLSSPERILHEVVSESTTVMAKIIQELSEETIESTKDYLKNLIAMPERREEFVALQNRLEKRSDLTKEVLSKCQKDQLEILVAVKMGIGRFLSGENHLPANELVEIFLFMMCRNVNCKSILPVDDCDCKFCSKIKGFCSSCMCPVCMNFDCASNTCSWVGCDVCSHWCHTACGLKQNLIRPGPSLKGQSGMQFHCIACNHSSEMFGFVKDVFLYCAKNWSPENLAKELDCVRKIFEESINFKGKELHMKAEQLLSKLERKIISPSDACDIIIRFFNYADSMPDFPTPGASAKEFMPAEASLKKDTATPPATSLPPKYAFSNVSSSTGRRDLLSNDLRRNELKAALLGDLKLCDELQFGRLSTKEGFDSLESIVRIKEAENKMFQNKADEARREAEGFRLMIQAKSEKLDQEYADKIAKLCLQETEERRRKKLEELKVLENSHCDYNNMKLRMKAEISSLLERMEATKQLWV